MGDRVRALGSDLTRAEHARALDRFEELAETLMEDEAKGAGYTAHVNLTARATDLTNKKTRWIPRGAGKLLCDGAVVIPNLIAEIRRRDALLGRAAELLTDPFPDDAAKIRAFLAKE